MSVAKAIVDLSTDITTVEAGPCKLHAIYVDVVLSANACPIVDGSVTQFSLIPALAPGTLLDFKGVVFEESLVIDPDNAATGTIVVFYEPLNKS